MDETLANPFASFSVSDMLRRGAGKLDATARQIAANYSNMGGDVAQALPGPPGMLARMLREYKRGKVREERGGEASMGPSPYAQESGDPGVRLGAMVADPANLLTGGAAGALKAGSKIARPAAKAATGMAEALRAPAVAEVPFEELTKRERTGLATVRAPQRSNFDIYRSPEVIAKEAALETAPESPMLKRLFNTSREELADVASTRGSVTDPRMIVPSWVNKPSGSEAAGRIMQPDNAARMQDIITQLRKHAPDLYTGMKGWYINDPKYKRMVELLGEEEATRLFRQQTMFQGIESPQMAVEPEMRRAAAANFYAEQGPEAFERFAKYGGLPGDSPSSVSHALRKKNLPESLTVPGRMGHVTTSGNQREFLETGKQPMNSPKGPAYVMASGVDVPGIGRQSVIPVGDTHWATAVGLGDVRTNASPYKSVTTAELQDLAPWWREQVAEPTGLEAVPAQAITWGGMGPRTGVRSKVGAPKLELEANLIGNRARQIGDAPENVRDRYLAGKEHLGFINPRLLAGTGALGVAGAGVVKALRSKDEPGDEKKVESGRKRDAELDAVMKELRRQGQSPN